MSYGLKILNGNLVINSKGKLERIENLEKLKQDCTKILVTSLGTNPFHRNYGSLLGKNIIGNVFEDSFVANIAETAIRSSLELLQRSQKNRALEQILTPDEILAAIKSIIVKRNEIDSRYFSILINILSGNAFSEQISFDMPVSL